MFTPCSRDCRFDLSRPRRLEAHHKPTTGLFTTVPPRGWGRGRRNRTRRAAAYSSDSMSVTANHVTAINRTMVGRIPCDRSSRSRNLEKVW